MLLHPQLVALSAVSADQRVFLEFVRDIARDHLEKLKSHEDKHEAKAQQIGRQREEHAASESKP